MDSQLTARVQAVLQELAAIRAELGTQLTDPGTGLAVSKIPAEYVCSIKQEIDQMRLFLWAYMDTWEVGSADLRNRLRQIRMETTAEMLQQLRKDFSITGVPPNQEGRRLAAQIRALTPLLPE